MQRPLQNYLRAHRKRAGLTVAEVAYLAGSEHGSTVSRHELGDRSVDVDAALAYAVVFGVGIPELFEGRAVRVEESVRKRAGELASSLRQIGGRKRAVELLERLSEGGTDS